MTTKFDSKGCLVAPAVTAQEIRDFRIELGMSQEEFATTFSIPIGTLRDWEQVARESLAKELFVRLITIARNLRTVTGSTQSMAAFLNSKAAVQPSIKRKPRQFARSQALNKGATSTLSDNFLGNRAG
jgi:hypothetical protein